MDNSIKCHVLRERVCGVLEIEDIAHVLFNCQLYATARALYLYTLFDWTTHWDFC